MITYKDWCAWHYRLGRSHTLCDYDIDESPGLKATQDASKVDCSECLKWLE
jgi:hypothetical protein